MMFIHHVLTFNVWWPASFKASGFLLWFSERFCEPTKLCVAIFAFITGYVYKRTFNNDNEYKKNLKKIFIFLLNYWLILLFLIIFAILTSSSKPTLIEIIPELFGVGGEIGYFCWYVCFYCISLLLLPIFNKLISYSKVSGLFFSIIFPYIFFKILRLFIPENLFINIGASNLHSYFPCILFGCYCQTYNCFERFNTFINKIFSNNIVKTVIIFIILCFSFLGRYCCKEIILGSLSFMDNIVEVKINLDIIYSFLFIYSSLYFIRIIKMNIGIVKKLGEHSTSMWFIHCIFFNKYSELANSWLYSFRYPIVILLVAITVCFIFSLLFDKAFSKLKAKLV